MDSLGPEDLEAVVSLESRCFPDPWGKAAVAGAMACSRTTLLALRTAIDPATVSGYLSFRVIVAEAEILRIAVTRGNAGAAAGRRYWARASGGRLLPALERFFWRSGPKTTERWISIKHSDSPPWDDAKGIMERPGKAPEFSPGP